MAENKDNKTGKNNTKENNKKRRYLLPKTAFDWICDIVILLVIALCLVAIVPPAVKHFKDKAEREKQQEALKEAQKNATPTPTATPLPDNIIAYDQLIKSENGNNDTTFSLEFNTEDKTYEDRVSASSLSDVMDSGSYKEKDDKIITKSEKNKAEEAYIVDGDYIILEESIYKGKIPKDAGEAFDAEFTYLSAKNGVYRELQLSKDGKYTLVKAPLKEDVEEADLSKSTAVKGEYSYDGEFITFLSTSDGADLIPYYVYKNKISNTYYVKRND